MLFDNALIIKCFFIGAVVVPILAIGARSLKNNYIFNAKHKKLFRYLDNVNPDKECNYNFKSKKRLDNGFRVKYKVLNEIPDIDYLIKNESRIKSFLKLDNSYKILPNVNYETLTIEYKRLKPIVYNKALLKQGHICIGSTFGGVHYLPISKAAHSLIVGSPGAGKSTLLNFVMASLFYNLDCKENYIEQVYYVDFKIVEQQKFRNLHSKVKTVIDFKEFNNALIELNSKLELKTNDMLKNNKLKLEGYLNLMIIDESTDFFSAYNSIDKNTNAELKDILKQSFNILNELIRKGRAFNIIIWFATQKSSGEQISTSIRDLLINRYCLKTPTPELVLDNFYKELPKYGANPLTFESGEMFVYEPTNNNFAGIVKCPYSEEFEDSGYLWDILNNNRNGMVGVGLCANIQLRDKSASTNPNASNPQTKSKSRSVDNADNNSLNSSYTQEDYLKELNYKRYYELYDSLPVSKIYQCKTYKKFEMLKNRFENLRARTDYLDKDKQFARVVINFGKCIEFYIYIKN